MFAQSSWKDPEVCRTEDDSQLAKRSKDVIAARRIDSNGVRCPVITCSIIVQWIRLNECSFPRRGCGHAMTRHEFSVATKVAAWRRANGKCENCRLPFGGRRPEYHHMKDDFFGGTATLENCLCICPPCHRWFTSQAAPRMAKTRRQEKSVAGIKPKSRSMLGSRRYDHRGKKCQKPR
jgi:5-methylcytosine-specific restriction enzyme A